MAEARQTVHRRNSPTVSKEMVAGDDAQEVILVEVRQENLSGLSDQNNPALSVPIDNRYREARSR